MKKLLKKILPAMALAMAVCVGAMALAACGEKAKDVVFSETKPTFGNMPTEVTLTLKTDGTAVFDLTIPSLSAENQFQTMFDKTGTWKLENDVYTVTLGTGDKTETLKSVYDKETKKHTIAYTLQGPEMSIEFSLAQQ